VSLSNIGKRVLVVDNDPRVRKTTTEILESKGYEVHAVEGAGKALTEDAHHLLSKHRCHLVVLDLRLFSDNDPEDWSGLDFASKISQQYPWVACVFLTGYKSFELAHKALGPEAVAFDIALKENGPAELVRVVGRAFSDHIRCRWDQHLEPTNGLTLGQLIKPLIDLDIGQQLSVSIIRSEFIEILGRLFPEADTLRLMKLSDYESSTSLTNGHAVLLRVEAHQDGRWLEDVAIKISSRQAIQREAVNYDGYVDGQIGDFRYTSKRMHSVIWHLGGIVYTLIGAELDNTRTFGEFYRQTANDKIEALGEIFENLFGRLFHRWYGTSEQSQINLWNEYGQALGLGQERLSRLGWGKNEQLEFAGLFHPLPNPLWWIEKYATNSNVLAGRHIIHGDLHSRNILVGPDKGVWLIDFERTGIGHCLRDLIEMETDIKFSLLSLEGTNTHLFYNLEVALLAQDISNSAQTFQPPSLVSKHPEANRAFSAIINLRRLAVSKASPDMRDYYWGLLCQTLFVATLSHLSEEARRRAKLSAALICERLGDGCRLRQPWPPNDLLFEQH
jgi:CheY-like chemotaxis protein